MKHPWLHATALAFALCGTSAAQHSVLVEHDDRNDPCRRFKMRLLVPADRAGNKLRVKKPADALDPKMVWDPCRIEATQFAIGLPAPLPDKKGRFFTSPAFKLQFPFEVVPREGKPPESLLPEPRPTFKFRWQRQR